MDPEMMAFLDEIDKRFAARCDSLVRKIDALTLRVGAPKQIDGEVAADSCGGLFPQLTYAREQQHANGSQDSSEGEPAVLPEGAPISILRRNSTEHGYNPVADEFPCLTTKLENGRAPLRPHRLRRPRRAHPRRRPRRAPLHLHRLRRPWRAHPRRRPQRAPPRQPRLHRPRRAPLLRRPRRLPPRPPRPRRRRRAPLRLRLHRQRRAPPRPPWLRQPRRASTRRRGRPPCFLVRVQGHCPRIRARVRARTRPPQQAPRDHLRGRHLHLQRLPCHRPRHALGGASVERLLHTMSTNIGLPDLLSASATRRAIAHKVLDPGSLPRRARRHRHRGKAVRPRLLHRRHGPALRGQLHRRGRRWWWVAGMDCGCMLHLFDNLPSRRPLLPRRHLLQPVLSHLLPHQQALQAVRRPGRHLRGRRPLANLHQPVQSVPFSQAQVFGEQVREERRYLFTFLATHLIGAEMLGRVKYAPLDENDELEARMQQPWPSLAILPLRPSPWPLFGHRKMMQLLGACLELVSNSAQQGGMCGTIIVGSQQNYSSSHSLVSCRVNVCIANVMVEVFVRGRCWSLTPTQGCDNKLLCTVQFQSGQLMCVERSYKFSSCRYSILFVARFLIVQLQWQPEIQPRPPPWPSFRREQDVQCFSSAKTFAMGARAVNSFGRLNCKLTVVVQLVWTVWELKLESTRLKCGASADHIPIISGLCTGYDLCNMSSSSPWDPGGSLFLLHHRSIGRVKMLIVSCRVLILLGTMCNMMIQSSQWHDDVFCRILWLVNYASNLYYNCRNSIWFKVIRQLLALVIAIYFVQQKRDGLTHLDSHFLFHAFGISCWGLLAEMRPISIWLVQKLYRLLNSYALLDSLMGHYIVWTWAEASNNVDEFSMHTLVNGILLGTSATSTLGSSVHAKSQSIQVPWDPDDIYLQLQTTVHWLEGKPILKEEGMSGIITYAMGRHQAMGLEAYWAMSIACALEQYYKRAPGSRWEASTNIRTIIIIPTLLFIFLLKELLPCTQIPFPLLDSLALDLPFP